MTLKTELQDRLEDTKQQASHELQNLPWHVHKAKEQIYGDLTPISAVVARRRVGLVGGCRRM